MIERRFLHAAAAGDAGVVDQNLDRPVLGHDFGEGLAHRGVIVDIERGKMNGKPFFRDDLPELRAAIQIAHGRDDGMSGARERNGGRESDAAARSGDQSQRHGAPPFA